MKLVAAKLTYQQPGDCCEDTDRDNYLTIETQDGGGGVYAVISTERWAVNSGTEFGATILAAVRDLLAMVEQQEQEDPTP